MDPCVSNLEAITNTSLFDVDSYPLNACVNKENNFNSSSSNYNNVSS